MAVDKIKLRFAVIQYYEEEVDLREYAKDPASTKSKIETLNGFVKDPTPFINDDNKSGVEIDHIGYDILE